MSIPLPATGVLLAAGSVGAIALALHVAGSPNAGPQTSKQTRFSWSALRAASSARALPPFTGWLDQVARTLGMRPAQLQRAYPSIHFHDLWYDGKLPGDVAASLRRTGAFAGSMTKLPTLTWEERCSRDGSFTWYVATTVVGKYHVSKRNVETHFDVMWFGLGAPDILNEARLGRARSLDAAKKIAARDFDLRAKAYGSAAKRAPDAQLRDYGNFRHRRDKLDAHIQAHRQHFQPMTRAESQRFDAEMASHGGYPDQGDWHVVGKGEPARQRQVSTACRVCHGCDAFDDNGDDECRNCLHGAFTHGIRS